MKTVVEHVEILRSSEKFRLWAGPNLTEVGGHRSNLMAERHYEPSELAELWGVSVQTIREIFKSEEGVLKIGSNGTKSRRRYMTLRIPESVAERVHTRLSA